MNGVTRTLSRHVAASQYDALPPKVRHEPGGRRAAGTRRAPAAHRPGHAARCGLMAALLAARGFECSDTMIEGAKGFAVSFASRPNFDAGLDALGKTFEITTLAYKPYPSGVVIHPIIDACLEIAGPKPLEAAQIERIELTVNPLAVKLTNLVEPKDRGQGLVSMQHWPPQR